MDSRYADLYRDLYLRHWWWRAREEVVVRRIAQLGLPPRAAILDIGCGDALLFPRLLLFGDVQGLEADAALLRDTTLTRFAIHVGPFDSTFRPSKRFDLILMLDVLEHLDEPIARLRQVRDLLAPGGRAHPDGAGARKPLDESRRLQPAPQMLRCADHTP